MRHKAGFGLLVLGVLGVAVPALAENSGVEVSYSWDCSDTGDWPGADSAVFQLLLLGEPVDGQTATWYDLDSSIFESVVWSDSELEPGDYEWDVRCYAGAEDLGINTNGSVTLLPVGDEAWSGFFSEVLDYVINFVMDYGVPVLFALVVLGLLVRAGVRWAKRAGRVA